VKRQRVIEYEEEIPKTLDGFKTWEFSSGPTTGEDFVAFAQLFGKYIKSALPFGCKLVDLHRGHYDLSGFVEYAGRFAYFSISDVRHFPGDWHENILIRTAKSARDYTGGSNGRTTLEKFGQDIGKLLESPMVKPKERGD
jgi:hypothetical protein